jgi:organic radical activating enzyme
LFSFFFDESVSHWFQLHTSKAKQSLSSTQLSLHHTNLHRQKTFPRDNLSMAVTQVLEPASKKNTQRRQFFFFFGGIRVSSDAKSNRGMTIYELLKGWTAILTGRAPMLSIEITRECPLSCPGCYAYGENHLGGGVTLRQLSDYRGDELVRRVLALVEKHRPIHVSLVGGEPMIRHRELDRILPVLGEMRIHTLLVTSGIIPVPKEWMKIPLLRVAVSVDGLPEHHDVRRKPATYERILTNIAGCTVNIHWVITRPMLARRGYLEEYISFWSARPEVHRIWASTYTPQVGEQSSEMLTSDDKRELLSQLAALRHRYPKFLNSPGLTKAYGQPPANPQACLFSRMSTNYSSDLRTRIEPCVLGGTPDCSQCGCIASVGLHSLSGFKVAGPVKAHHLVRASMAVGKAIALVRKELETPQRWHSPGRYQTGNSALVRINPVNTE